MQSLPPRGLLRCGMPHIGLASTQEGLLSQTVQMHSSLSTSHLHLNMDCNVPNPSHMFEDKCVPCLVGVALSVCFPARHVADR